MDLNLNKFRLDLLECIKNHPELDKTSYGLHAVVPALPDIPAGVIYILKNRANNINLNNQNRLHPFYMVYVANNGDIICDHLSPKQLLDKIRLLCKDKRNPLQNCIDNLIKSQPTVVI